MLSLIGSGPKNSAGPHFAYGGARWDCAGTDFDCGIASIPILPARNSPYRLRPGRPVEEYLCGRRLPAGAAPAHDTAHKFVGELRRGYIQDGLKCAIFDLLLHRPAAAARCIKDRNFVPRSSSIRRGDGYARCGNAKHGRRNRRLLTNGTGRLGPNHAANHRCRIAEIRRGTRFKPAMSTTEDIMQMSLVPTSIMMVPIPAF